MQLFTKQQDTVKKDDELAKLTIACSFTRCNISNLINFHTL